MHADLNTNMGPGVEYTMYTIDLLMHYAVQVCINGHNVTMHIDTGSSLSVVNTATFEELRHGGGGGNPAYIENLLQRLPLVAVFIENIIISGTVADDNDHLRNLQEVMQRLIDANLCLKR